MHTQLQANIKFYARTLESTGGALAWEKCKVYLLMFTWINGIKIMLSNKNDFPPLHVESLLTGIAHFIALANPEEAFRMLGAFVAPNGSTATQVKVLKGLAQKWANKIAQSYLSPHEALVAYVQVLFPALVYPVAVMPLSLKDCDDIVRPAIKTLLEKMKLPANTNRSLLYGPARYGGMELPNLYVYGNVLKLMMFIGHFQKQDTTMPILRVALGCMQQQTGMSRPVLETDYNKYQFLAEDCWIKHVWKFLSEINGRIKIENQWMPKSLFQDDLMIIDKVLAMDLPDTTIAKFNQCRLQKQINFITDILDSKHKGLHPKILEPGYTRHNHEKFPVIQVPHRYWKLWDNIICTNHASVRVSGFHAGPMIHKAEAIWLQHENRTKLLYNIGSNKYKCFKLISYSRLQYIYDSTVYHAISLSDLIGYHGVQVAEEADILTTDGYDLQTHLPHQSIDPISPTFSQNSTI